MNQLTLQQLEILRRVDEVRRCWNSWVDLYNRTDDGRLILYHLNVSERCCCSLRDLFRDMSGCDSLHYQIRLCTVEDMPETVRRVRGIMKQLLETDK